MIKPVLSTLAAALLLLGALACGDKPAPEGTASPETAAAIGAGAGTAAPAADAPAEAAPAAPVAAGNRLVIVTPHDETTKLELEPAFKAWYQQQHPGAPAPEIEWQDRGGSVDINKYLDGAYTALGDKKDEGVGIDLYFGGGLPAHIQLMQKDLSARTQLSSATLSSFPAELAGVPLRDPEGRWFGIVLSSFGIIYNKPGLAGKNIAPPQTWSDLTNPALSGLLVLADPAKSGSARVCYEVVLQKYGWDEGWAKLMQIAGNTREFSAHSANVPREVAQGSALAGMCIDYHGFSQVSQTGADQVGYVNPNNATAITPDPIAVLRGAPNPELARAFIEYLLTPQAQAMWALKSGTPGGPAKNNLFRMPIVPATYDALGSNSIITENPYKSPATFNLNQQLADQRAGLIGPLFTAAFLSNKALLLDAWKAVTSHPEKPELMAQFCAPPFAEAEAAGLLQRYTGSQRDAIQLDMEWQEAYRQRYEAIIQAAR